MDDKELQNLLFSAIQHHNVTLLDDLLDGNNTQKFLDSPNDDGNMLLHLAVIENHLQSVECLLKHGANPNVFDTIRARTPLHLAVELGHTDIVKAFLELDYINLNIRDDRNLTCYEIAQFCDNQGLAELIKSRHDNSDQMKDDFYTVINQACSSDQPQLLSELLVKYRRRILEKLPKGWITEKNGELFASASLKELINWSSSSWNDVTLLFKSASKGYTEVCRVLIEFGATAKCNENTNYSPLYVAAYGGFTSTVRLLLENFPSLINEKTIEKWTVLHACCLQGHSETAKLILTYSYPEKLMSRFVSRSGVYEYNFAFDLNAQDAAGQTVIYLAVSANNEKLLDTLLHFNVEAKLLSTPQTRPQDLPKPSQSSESNPRASTTVQHARIVPDRHKVESRPDIESPQANNQLDKIIRQLCKMNTKDDTSDNMKNVDSEEMKSGEDKYLICPFEVDTYCDYNSKTALHLAVCQQYHSIATTLLVNGANPNLPILSRDSVKNDFSSPIADAAGLSWLRSSKSTCLREASRLNDEYMCDILIRYGASDNQDNLALQVVASNKNARLISKFLSLKSNLDPEYKINKKCNVEFAARYKQNQRVQSNKSSGTITTTFSSMFPSAPVMIDWQNLKCIRQLDPQWFIDASLMHNKRLKYPTTGLMAITRLDLSGNGLKTLHPVIFRLPSLRELNLSKNRLESLLDFSQRLSVEGQIPTSKLIESHKTSIKRSKSSNLSPINLETSNIIDLNEPQEWDLPHLEILDLHDNRLISLPDCLFSLPRLSELDVSSNQIRRLPWSMWTAPALKELIASGNLLDDLPKIIPRHSLSPSSQTPEFRDSLSDERSSMTSNTPSVNNEKLEILLLSKADSDRNKHDQNCTQNLDSSDFSTIQLESSNVDIEHLNYWKHRVELVSGLKLSDFEDKPDSEEGLGTESKITYLNLSHNSFVKVPEVLACLATGLIRFNLSYNRIQSMGDISLYPAKVKNLDLSHNQITQWFSTGQSDEDNCHDRLCFADSSREDTVISRFISHRSLFCPHKQHSRLEGLKSLNLSHNLLKDIHLMLPVDQNVSSRSKTSKDDSESSFTLTRDSLLYPNITALDLSFNRIQQVPKSLSNLRDLSVLNLSHNISISSLPAELGLAGKLWNLSVLGCNMSEPLKSILESKSYKTMDIIGYLRSILEESKPYARMKLMLVGLQGIGKTSLLEQMRLEGGSTSGLRRHAPEHWTKRMGHATRSNLRNQKGVTLSTVGVDIHDWVFNKRTPRNQPSFGPVSFSTWDFGGQHEFYATHRYFLSRRSLYLVVWRLTDGLEGIVGIQQWLVNIQSRASGSPVIIVGTHEDMIEGGERGEKVQQLQEEVHRRFINVSDHDKCGLPRVMDSIVVSTKTKLNIKNLCNRIYDVVFSLRCPGGTERLLEQKIPATYLYLEDIISSIVQERHQKKREPVLTYEEYRRLAADQLSCKYNKTFRDLEPLNSREINYNSELQQATRFLHENGVLLHYEDANLRDLYFLDPQWLCDILSHVVTIREINPHVKNGLMKIDDLAFLFKSININLSGGIQSYVVNLLNKFEVALTWNSQYLLIPSLLPADPSQLDEQQDFKIKMTPRMRGRSAVRRQFDKPNRSTSIEPCRARPELGAQSNENLSFEIEQQPERTLYRLTLLRYLPAGFLARLQSGILSEPTFDDVCTDLQAHFAQEFNGAGKLSEFMGNKAGWTCWQHGIKLGLQHESTINNRSKQAEHALLSIEELSTMEKKSSYLNKIKFKVECAQMGSSFSSIEQQADERPNVEIVSSNWCNLDLAQYSNVIVVSVYRWRLKVTRKDGSIKYLDLERQSMAKLLASAVDHIDNLLEDWYPSLGTRFVHTLGGNYLVTRVVPCMSCFAPLANCTPKTSSRQSRIDSSRSRAGKVNFSIDSAQDQKQQQQDNGQQLLQANEVSCFYVEHCIFNAYNMSFTPIDKLNQRKFSLNSPTTTRSNSPLTSRKLGRNLRCIKHGAIPLASIAPDIVFEDVSDFYKIESEQIERCKLIGRGTFGFVFKGSLRSERPSNEPGQEVALKLLQPVDPGPEAENCDMVVYKSARSIWLREPFHCACKSYCTARHEVNILQTLRHPNIVLFVGLCVKPLAVVLELAPMGCLQDVFKTFKRAGMRIEGHLVQKTVLQVARALEFLHQQRVIYRDLKAENVLVWSFPSPFATTEKGQVELKLADYGISRQALSTGIWKGFAGTINFLAPEILRHNGDEEYTEKVDCFSFGMFMYELITLRPPFKHNEAFKNHLADGGRPTLTGRDLVYPNYMIDLMSVCWSQDPHHRPTASQIVSIASTPEFMQSLDVVPLADQQDSLSCCAAIQYLENNPHNPSLDLWFGTQSSQFNILSADGCTWAQCQQLRVPGGDPSASSRANCCMCIVENKIWLADSKLNVHVLPLGSRLRDAKGGQNLSSIIETQDESLNRAQTFQLDTKSNNRSIKQMIFVKSVHCVLLLTDGGQLWLCQLDTMQCKQLDDNSVEYLCMATQEETPAESATPDGQQQPIVLYCGQRNGISRIELLNEAIHRQSISPLSNKLIDLSGERIIEVGEQPMDVSHIVASKYLVWTSAGCTVHLWSLKYRCVFRRLDCWKLVPCSESLESINIENYYQQAKSSVVSSMVNLNNQLFVGTSHGCFMVIEADSLKPITVFRPYESAITILVPTLIGDDDDDDDSNQQQQQPQQEAKQNMNAAFLVTVGKGYRDLMRRYVSSLDDSSVKSSGEVAILWSSNYNQCVS